MSDKADIRSILGNLQVTASALRMNASALEQQAKSLESYAAAIIAALNGLSNRADKDCPSHGMDGDKDSPSAVQAAMDNDLDNLSSEDEDSDLREEAVKQESESGSQASSSPSAGARDGLSIAMSIRDGLRNGQSKRRRGQSKGGLPRAMAAAWDGCDGISISGTSRAHIANCEALLVRLAAEHSADPIELFKTAVARFKADENVRKRRLGLGTFLGQLEQWCWPDVKGGNGRGAPAAVSTLADFEAEGFSSTEAPHG